MFSVVRTVADPLSAETQAKLVVASMDPSIPVTDVRTMQNRIGLQLAQPRFAMVLLSVFAGLALILTLVGLYGIMAYSVATRRREIGVRLALGAPRKTVFRTVMNQAALLVIAGTGLGVVGALGSGSMLHAYLYGTEARDPIVLAVVCGLVAAMGLMAAYLPACRAMEVEPAVALRCE